MPQRRRASSAPPDTDFNPDDYASVPNDTEVWERAYSGDSISSYNIVNEVQETHCFYCGYSPLPVRNCRTNCVQCGAPSP